MAATALLQGRYPRQMESLIEAFLGFALLLGINLVWFGEDPGYLNVSPHPFLFLTILIAARYGTFDGLITGLLSAGVFATYLVWGRGSAGDVVRSFEWHAMLPAYLFILMGLLVGEIRQMADREVRKALGEVRALKTQLAAVRGDNDLLTRVKDELQGRILSAEDPLARFYDSARKLSTLRPEEAYPAIMELVGRFTGAEKYGLYLAETIDEGVPGRPAREVFRLTLQHGWDAPDEFDTVLDVSHPAVARAVRTGEVVTVRDIPDSGADILACVALNDPIEQRGIGLVVLHRIPFVRLTQMTLTHLFTIAGWAGKTLADARRLDLAMEARVDDESTGTYNFRFTGQRLAEECARVRRYGGSCGLLLVRVVDFEMLPPEDRREVLARTGKVLVKQLRTVDVVGTYRMPGVFALVLPETNAAQGVIVSARVHDAFRKAFSGARFDYLRLKMGLAVTREDAPLAEGPMMDQAERFELRPDRAD